MAECLNYWTPPSRIDSLSGLLVSGYKRHVSASEAWATPVTILAVSWFFFGSALLVMGGQAKTERKLDGALQVLGPRDAQLSRRVSCHYLKAVCKSPALGGCCNLITRISISAQLASRYGAPSRKQATWHSDQGSVIQLVPCSQPLAALSGSRL